MTDIVVTGLEAGDVERLERRAKAHGCSLQEEIKYLVTRGLDAPEHADRVLDEIKAGRAEMGEKLNDLRDRTNTLKTRLIEDGIRDAESFKELDQEFEDMLRLARSAGRHRQSE